MGGRPAWPLIQPPNHPPSHSLVAHSLTTIKRPLCHHSQHKGGGGGGSPNRKGSITKAIKDAYYAATGFEGCNAVVSLEERLLIQYWDQIVDKSTLAKMVGTNKAYDFVHH